MKKLIKKFLKNPDEENLHNLRIEARRRLSLMEKESKTDKSLENLLKNSSKLRDVDVQLQICEKKKIKKFLKKKRKKLLKKFFNFVKNYKPQIEKCEQKEPVSLKKCKKLLSKTFLDKSDKELHEIRIEIKKCRYTCKKHEKEFKKIQDILGKIHDYYKCMKLMKKFEYDTSHIISKKKELLKKAEKRRKEIKRSLN